MVKFEMRAQSGFGTQKNIILVVNTVSFDKLPPNKVKPSIIKVNKSMMLWLISFSVGELPPPSRLQTDTHSELKTSENLAKV